MLKRLTRSEFLAAVGITSNALDKMSQRNQSPFGESREKGIYLAIDAVLWELANRLVPTFGRDKAAKIVRENDDLVPYVVDRVENRSQSGILLFVGSPPPPDDEISTVLGGTYKEITADLEQLTAEDRASSVAFIDMNKLLADVRARAKAGGIDLSGKVFVLTEAELAERRNSPEFQERLRKANAARSKPAKREVGASAHARPNSWR